MTSTEQFSLRWNNYYYNLTSGFQNLFEAHEMVDVTLAVDGQFLQAHKLVLAIFSPFFKQLFKLNPCKHPIVILNNVTYDNLKDILEFMYLGEVNVKKDDLATFLSTAELLQVKGLTGDYSNANDSNNLSEDSSSFEKNEEENCCSSNMFSNNHFKRSCKNDLLSSGKKKTKKDVLSSPITDYDNKNEIANKELIDMKKTKQNEETGKNMPLTMENRHPFQCDVCMKNFSRRDHLKTHIKNIHGEDVGPFACVICSQLYKNAESLRKHIAKFHFPKLSDTQQQNKLNKQ